MCLVEVVLEEVSERGFAVSFLLSSKMMLKMKKLCIYRHVKTGRICFERVCLSLRILGQVKKQSKCSGV